MKPREFLDSIAELAEGFRQKIELEVEAFPIDTGAREARIKAVADPETGYRFFCDTYFPHYFTKTHALPPPRMTSRSRIIRMGPDVFNALNNHPKIKEQFKYTSSESLTAEMLAKYFNIEKVIVGQAVFLAENASDDTDAQDVWGNDAILSYTPTVSANGGTNPVYCLPRRGVRGFVSDGVLGVFTYDAGMRLNFQDVPVGELAHGFIHTRLIGHNLDGLVIKPGANNQKLWIVGPFVCAGRVSRAPLFPMSVSYHFND